VLAGPTVITHELSATDPHQRAYPLKGWHPSSPRTLILAGGLQQPKCSYHILIYLSSALRAVECQRRTQQQHQGNTSSHQHANHWDQLSESWARGKRWFCTGEQQLLCAEGNGKGQRMVLMAIHSISLALRCLFSS